MKNTCWVLLMAAFIASCHSSENYTKSANGLDYRIITDAKNPKAQLGQVMKYDLYWRTDKDSLVLSTKAQNKPYYSRIDKPQFKGDPMELLSLLGKDDSAQCEILADLLFQGTPLAPFKHGDNVKLDFKVLDIMSEDDYDLMAEQQVNQAYYAQLKALEDYMTTNKLQGEKTASGMYIVVEKEGTGKQVQSGNTVKVLYTGKLLDGTVFDASDKHGGDPYSFVVGKGQVIKGWDEGLTHFKAGGKGMLLIPSKLGYGEKGSPGSIPPNSPLIFDIEVTDVQ